LTGGEDGVQGVPRGRVLGVIDLSDGTTMYYFVLAITVSALLAIRRIVRSPFGHVLRAIRDNEARAVSLGYEVGRYKLLAFVLSATLAGIAGGTKALVFQFAALTDIQWQMSGEAILMTLAGGVGTFVGPVLGAALLLSVENYLGSYDIPVGIATGAIFIACVIFFRGGIVGEVAARIAARRRPAPKTDARSGTKAPRTNASGTDAPGTDAPGTDDYGPMPGSTIPSDLESL
jgi:branched-chain amino acid transport system permease protein